MLFSFLRNLNFCRHFLIKAQVKFKIYDVENCEINNYNEYIARYFKKIRQSDNEIWLVGEI